MGRWQIQPTESVLLLGRRMGALYLGLSVILSSQRLCLCRPRGRLCVWVGRLLGRCWPYLASMNTLLVALGQQSSPASCSRPWLQLGLYGSYQRSETDGFGHSSRQGRRTTSIALFDEPNGPEQQCLGFCVFAPPTSPHRVRQCVSWISVFRHWLAEVGEWPLEPVAGSPESCAA